MMLSNHFFHLVNVSPWPILFSLNFASLSFSIIDWISNSGLTSLLIFLINLILIVSQWWRDVIREALYEGARSVKINSLISFGMILFIVSEICFFGSFFWAYFFFSLSPDLSMGLAWPPVGVQVVDFLGIPLLNTLILLGSGVYVTWGHYSMGMNNLSAAKLALMLSIILGIYFILVQLYEYLNLSFSFSESAFGCSFFILTGFHGFHVLVGLVFIMANFIRLSGNSFSCIGMLGLEYSIWYWHFVDLVWLFLYCFIYWWGS